MTRAASPPSHLRVVLQIVLTLGALTLALWVVYRLAAILLVLIAAALLAYVLAPLVHRAQSPLRVAGRTRRLPRAAAIGLVYLLMAGVLGLGVMLLLPSAIEQADQAIAGIPLQVQSVLTWEHGWSRYYSRLPMPPEVRHRLDESVAEAGQSTLLLQLRASIQAVAGWMTSLPWLIAIPVLAFFLRVVEDYVIYPRLIRRGLELHPLAVIAWASWPAPSCGESSVCFSPYHSWRRRRSSAVTGSGGTTATRR